MSALDYDTAFITAFRGDYDDVIHVCKYHKLFIRAIHTKTGIPYQRINKNSMKEMKKAKKDGDKKKRGTK